MLGLIYRSVVLLGALVVLASIGYSIFVEVQLQREYQTEDKEVGAFFAENAASVPASLESFSSDNEELNASLLGFSGSYTLDRETAIIPVSYVGPAERDYPSGELTYTFMATRGDETRAYAIRSDSVFDAYSMCRDPAISNLALMSRQGEVLMRLFGPSVFILNYRISRTEAGEHIIALVADEDTNSDGLLTCLDDARFYIFDVEKREFPFLLDIRVDPKDVSLLIHDDFKANLVTTHNSKMQFYFVDLNTGVVETYIDGSNAGYASPLPSETVLYP